MCGIAASIINNGKLDSLISTKSMLESQAHRGPDGKATWCNPDGMISIGHNRLAIIEPTDIGNQPWISEKSVLSWNGEIYNYTEIRIKLEQIGRIFRTKTDSEVLSIGYEEWGDAIFKRLRGMFSILIYDLKKEQLIIARDRLGIKPLYYAKIENSWFFASETRSLRTLGSTLSEINFSMVNRFLKDGTTVYKNETFYANIFTVEPGQVGVIDKLGHGPQFHKYWDFDISQIGRRIKRKNISENLVSETIKSHLTSDVPICTTLSGGLDSSIITAISAKNRPNETLQTFSLNWPENLEIDESEWVDEIVDFLKVSNLRTTIKIDDFDRLVDQVLRIQDEPFASSTVIAQFQLYQFIKQHGYKVTLDGQGADEVFIGYQSLIPILIRNQFLSFKFKLLKSNLINLFLYRKNMNISFRWFINLILTLFAPKVLLKRIQFPGVINLIDALRLNLVLGPNLQSLLRYLDRNSMAASIEARVPFLDHVLVEEVLRSSPQDGFVDGKMKSYLRETFKNYLPTAILERRSKLGYTTPETAWLKTINEESPYANNNKIGTLGWRKYILAKWIEMIQKFDSQ